MAIKHSQISINIKAHEIEDINSVDDSISSGSKLTLSKLIMDLKTEDYERFAIAITRNLNGALEIWAKKKNKKLQV